MALVFLKGPNSKAPKIVCEFMNIDGFVMNIEYVGLVILFSQRRPNS
jgi:hypothetical protein